jgi:hypothetical protein
VSGTVEKKIPIESVIEEISSFHQKIKNNFGSSFNYACEIGKRLQQVKKNLQHGEYGIWLEQNCEFSNRTAQNYVDLYENRQKIEDRGPNSFNDAYDTIKLIKRERNLKLMARIDKLVDEFERTGIKPKGWNEFCDAELRDRQEARESAKDKKLADETNDLTLGGKLQNVFTKIDKLLDNDQPKKIHQTILNNIEKYIKRKRKNLE